MDALWFIKGLRCKCLGLSGLGLLFEGLHLGFNNFVVFLMICVLHLFSLGFRLGVVFLAGVYRFIRVIGICASSAGASEFKVQSCLS